MAEIPRTIGKYKIQEQIAQGGMGAIYKSVHPELKRAIIIKKMTIRGNALAREQFLPDHGTGYDIACKNEANPESMRCALYTAIDIYRHRINYDEAYSHPLRHQHLDRKSVV